MVRLRITFMHVPIRSANDRDALLRHTADDFIYVRFEGQAMTLEQRAAANQSSIERPERQSPIDTKIRVYSDTIITSGRGVFSSRACTQAL